MMIGALRPTFSAPPVKVSSPAATPTTVDRVTLGADRVETEAERKARLLGEMVHARDENLRASAVQLLGQYPLHAVERVHAFGTRIEFYGPGEALPADMVELRTPGYLGGYNRQTNVIGILQENANTFTVLHEFAHALDAALDDVSETPAWQRGFEEARGRDRSVRQNARKNPQEYLADDVAAWLIPDNWLPPLIHAAQQNQPDAARDRQDYSHGRLQRKDPQGYLLAEALLTRDVVDRPAAPPRPAPAR